MENKYYTPALEDLHIGYECLLFSEFIDDYQKINLTADETCMDLEDWLNKGYIRTPYLTKEQIKAEGWQSISPSYCFKMTKEGETRVHFIKEFDSIVIDRNQSVVYDGKCPSINEFRKIAKLLEI